MAATELDKLRNVGILGQGGSGKTSLGEAMLFAAGATQRLGKVLDGTSVLDHEPEEIKHHISISTAFHSLSWNKFPITLIDTPGYAAFLGRLDQLHARVFGSCRLRAQSRRWACASSPSVYGRKPMTTVSAGCCLSARWTMSRPTCANASRPCSKLWKPKGVYLADADRSGSRVQRRRRSVVDEGICLRGRLGKIHRRRNPRRLEGRARKNGARKWLRRFPRPTTSF